MGLDYSFRLYFHRKDLWDVLQGIADISVRTTLPTLVIFPDFMRAYPIEGWGDRKKIIPWNDPAFGFTVAINFEKDEEIVEYLRRMHGKDFYEASTENPAGIPIGSVYIEVYSDLNRFEAKDWDPDIVLIDFGTPGSHMSMLFFESNSIRVRFQELLERYQGICGVLNMEDYGYVIWYKGRRVDFRIPDPYMSPAEIETFLSNPGEMGQ